MAKTQNITKTDRQHIVTQKLSEIVDEENSRMLEKKAAVIEELQNGAYKEYMAACTAVEAYSSKIRQNFEEKTMPSGVSKQDRPSYTYTNNHECNVAKAKAIFEDEITAETLHISHYHRDILPAVLKWRGHENERIKNASVAAMNILVDGDLKEIEAFLDL
tara:strand:+ start:2372 stop:2854 length:483 start_codon:yes stop_codon:yes gene_type:complete